MNEEEIEIIEYEEKQGRIRLFLIDGAMQSAAWIDDDRQDDLVFQYMIQFAKCSSLHPSPKDLLMIGAGMLSYPRWLVSHNESICVDAVDPNEDLYEYACAYFGLDDLSRNQKERIHFIVDEGRHYLQTSTKKYDIIINDAFNGMEPVVDLCTKEAARAVRDRLNENGMYLVNLPGYQEAQESEYLKSSIQTLKQVFRHAVIVRAKGILSGDDSMNYVVMASDTYEKCDGQIAVDSEDAPVFADEEPEMIFDSFEWM